MANYCTNAIAFYGELNQLEALHGHIERTMLIDPHEPRITTLLDEMNLSTKVNDTRHFIINLNPIISDKDSHHFVLLTESAWCPMTEDFDAILKQPEFSTLDYVYTAEEPGMGIYINTDTTQRFLTPKYRFFSYMDDAVVHEEYFSSLADLVKWVNSIFSVFIDPNSTINSIITQLCKAYHDTDAEFFIDEYSSIPV